MKVSFDDNKQVLTLRNLFKEAFRFSARACSPAHFPLIYVLLYMIQSTEFVLSPEFAQSARKLDLSETEHLWSMIHDPESATVAQVAQVLFDPRTVDSKRFVHRYYIQIQRMSDMEDYEFASTTLHDTLSSTSSSNTPGLCKAQSIVQLCRASSDSRKTQSSPQYPTEDYVSLPDDDIPSYTIDTQGDYSRQDFACPQTYREMRAIVIDLRRQQDESSRSFRYSAPSSHPIHHTFPKPIAHKDRANDYDKFA